MNTIVHFVIFTLSTFLLIIHFVFLSTLGFLTFIEPNLHYLLNLFQYISWKFEGNPSTIWSVSVFWKNYKMQQKN